jgi:hypothetical protein
LLSIKLLIFLIISSFSLSGWWAPCAHGSSLGNFLYPSPIWT